ncbi:nickel transporter [Streptomyces sp. TRM64462]|uniref:nickel transporter n=1 Tax=Streptomyces sp. TRM64462 TaxID=2741726 RepID=UPI001586B28C|nr:nickel transporter [Streptomyces sp. TRM64462]
MRRRVAAARAAATLTAGLALAAGPAPAAQAHPLGDFTVNQYDGLVVAPGKLTVDHVEDLAEIPAAQETPRIDTDGDGGLSGAELSAWARARCASAARGARLTVGDTAVGVTAGGDKAGGGGGAMAGGARAEERAGQAGLRTLRVTCALTAALPRDDVPLVLRYAPADASAGPGWREITARGDRMTVSDTDVPETSVSRRLRAYPDDLLSSPPGLRSAAFTARPGGGAVAERDAGGGDTASPVAGVLPRGADRWARALTGLVARHELTVGSAVSALGVSVLLGALHALAPGHGKSLMAAAAAARGRGSLKEVLTFGASVTLTHTLGVLVLGALITAGSAAAPTVVSWLTVVSGAAVAAAGALLLRRAWRRRHAPHGHSHSHTHAHAHAPAHAHEHGHGHEHPAPHGHPHAHSHAPPVPGARGVVLMGLAGGLVPAPSAVVVLIGAAALGQAWFGFLLVLAYGAGLALTLAVTGLLVVRLRDTTVRRLARRPRDGGGLFRLVHRLAPLGTAAVVLVLGCGLLARGMAVTLG